VSSLIKQYLFAFLLLAMFAISMVKYIGTGDLFFVLVILSGICGYVCQLALFVADGNRFYSLYRSLGLALGLLSFVGVLAYIAIGLIPN
jgi:hypothetical protein